jgi:transketolase
MPNMTVFRPCDGVEAAECWELALCATTNGPSTLALTRQKVKSARTRHTDENLSAKGGYTISDADGAKAVLIATGSEVEIAMAAQAALAAKGLAVRVVSMPSMDLFEQQSESYQTETLGGDLPKVAVEAGVRFGWDRWIGRDGGFVGMSSFGASAPYQDLYNHFNITADAVVVEVEKRI